MVHLGGPINSNQANKPCVESGAEWVTLLSRINRATERVCAATYTLETIHPRLLGEKPYKEGPQLAAAPGGCGVVGEVLGRVNDLERASCRLDEAVSELIATGWR